MADAPTTLRLSADTRAALAAEAARRGMKPATLAVYLIEQGLHGMRSNATANEQLAHANALLDNLLPEGGTHFENQIVGAVGRLADAIAAMLG